MNELSEYGELSESGELSEEVGPVSGVIMTSQE